MTFQIYTPSNQIELDGQMTPLRATQQGGQMQLYLGENSKFGFFRFDTKKKTYFLAHDSITGKPSDDYVLFESEIHHALDLIKQAETLVKDLRDEGFDDQQIADVLCDGEALAKMGITDETIVELAYALVKDADK